MVQMITKCPSCDTSFRITDTQIKTAKGAVRCGACLHIFKAMDNLVESGAKKADPAKGESPVKPTVTGDQKASAPVESKVATPSPNPTKAPAKEAQPPAATNDSPAPADTTTEEPAPTKEESAPAKFEFRKPGPVSSVVAAAADSDDSVEVTEVNFDEEFGLQDEEIDIEETAENAEQTADPSTDFDFSMPRNSVPRNKATLDETNEPAAPVPAEAGMENMLSFDQSSIDNEDLHDNVFNEEDDDILISDDLELPDDDDESSAKNTDSLFGDDLNESVLDLDNWKPKSKPLFDRELRPRNDDDERDNKSMADESWAVDLLEDDDDDQAIVDFKFKTNPEMAPVQDSEFDEEFDFIDDDDAGTDYSRHTTGSFDALEDGDIEDALGSSLSDDIEPKISSDDDAFEFDDDEEDSDDYATSSDSDLDLSDLDEDYEEEESSDYYAELDRKAMLRGIEPEPVEFGYRYSRYNWKAIGIWGGSIAAGLLLLISQISIFNFDSLSRQQPYRGFYSVICPVVGCSVPSLAAPSMIKTTNFVVREHPSTADALVIDTIILNTADFAQPFPDLVINFSNLQGKLVATRRFKPTEYLGGEMAGRKSMPSNQPVHLALEIVNPGADAINYSAYIPN